MFCRQRFGWPNNRTSSRLGQVNLDRSMMLRLIVEPFGECDSIGSETTIESAAGNATMAKLDKCFV